MTSTTVAVRDAGTTRPAAPARPAAGPQANRADVDTNAASRRLGRPALGRNATDDDILGLGPAATRAIERGRSNDLDAQIAFDFDAVPGRDADIDAPDGLPQDAIDGDPESLRAVFDANPELRKDWQDAHAYRESFATPEEARNATTMLADLNRMDALFFSRRQEDHAELARSIASLDPVAFASLAKAMAAQGNHLAIAESPLARAANSRTEPSDYSAPSNGADNAKVERRAQHAVPLRDQNLEAPGGPSAAQTDFFHATNAAAVENVLDAIESQVKRLLPDGVSKNARNRVVGEIYRELDVALRSNRQLGQQMRDAFRSGSLDAEHQRAIVSMIAGRARQALPGVAKRVLSEWTSTVVAANQDRRARQRAAERRVDIAGSRGGGGEGHRATSPRDVDYARMSDADILNL